MRGMLRLGLALVILVSGACRPSSPTTVGGPIVRDSAGVRIVENVAPAWSEGSGWRLSDQAVVEIGVLEGEAPYMFSRVQYLHRLSDGSVVLIDSRSSQLRFFDGAGQHLRSVGRAGQGPGEFLYGPSYLALGSADSVVVWDALARRASVFSSRGEFGRNLSLAASSDSFVQPEVRGVFADGAIFAVAQPPFSASESEVTGPRWSINLLVRYSPEGEDPVLLGQFEFQPCHPARPSNVGTCSGTMRYTAWGSVQLHGDRIYRSRPDRDEISVLDSDGRLLSRIYGATPQIPITEAMQREVRQASLAAIDRLAATQTARPEEIRQVRESWEQASFSDLVPAFMRFLVSTDGHIWVEEYLIENSGQAFSGAYPPRTDPVRWTIYDPDGVLLGDIQIPVDLRITQIGSDHVLGITRDDLEVERVRMYAILKP